MVRKNWVCTLQAFISSLVINCILQEVKNLSLGISILGMNFFFLQNAILPLGWNKPSGCKTQFFLPIDYEIPHFLSLSPFLFVPFSPRPLFCLSLFTCPLISLSVSQFHGVLFYRMGCTLHQHGHGHSHGGGSGHGHSHEHATEAEGQDVDAERRRKQNINVRAAFIHVIGDFLQSVGVFIAAMVIYFKPNLGIIDPICTFIFSILVLITTIRILRDTLNVLMEGKYIYIAICVTSNT